MLSTNKPTLQNNIKIMLEKAVYKAYMVQYTPNQISQASSYDDKIKNELEKKAKEFSKKFAENASEPVATAIYDFVKEIGIVITIPPSAIAPPLPPTLPGGPCTGTIPMTNITIL